MPMFRALNLKLNVIIFLSALVVPVALGINGYGLGVQYA